MLKLLFWLAFVAAFLPAQTPLTVRDAVAQALASHPVLQAGEAHIRASESLRAQARLRPNPRLSFQAENLRGWGDPGFAYGRDADTFLYASQLLDTSRQRSRRVDVAAADVRRAELERELEARLIAARVKQAYWRAAAANRVLEVLRENSANFRQIVEYHETRVREGAMAEADLLRIRLEGERLEIEANTAGLEADRARIELFREMGQKQFPEIVFADALEPGPEVPPADLKRALERRTEIRLARQAVEHASALARLEEARSRPDVDVSVGYKRSAGFHTLLAGASLLLPISDRNQGGIAAARQELRVAEARLAAMEALVTAEVQAGAREYALRRRQVTASLPALRERAAESSRIAQAAYREGGTDLLRLLDAERTRLEAQMLYFRTLGDYQRSRIALETALGEEP